MSRLLRCLCAVLLLASVTPARAATPDAGPTDAGPAVAAPPPEDPPIAPERLKEARALVPAPLLYGQLQPVVGAWVEYAFHSKQGTFPVRAAVVGQTPRERDTLYQVELDYQTTPRALVVLWVSRAGDARPVVERLAVSLPPAAPLSIPVDLLADHPALRGALVAERDVDVKAGPFAGRGHERTFRRDAGQAVTVVTTAKVPVFGVQALREPDATWTALKAGTGATPSLKSVPLAVPRVPEP